MGKARRRKQGNATPVAIDPRGGTPGRREADGVSRPGDATDMVKAVAEFHHITEKEAASMIEQARSDMQSARRAGWDPFTTSCVLLFELALLAHAQQVNFEGLKVHTGHLLPAYYDMVGRYMHSQGETQEARDATVGVEIPAMH